MGVDVEPVARRRGRPALGRSTPLEHDEILGCALELVRSEGGDALSMRRLARELGVSPMALYYYFPDKTALMAGLVRCVWDDLLQRPLAPGNSPIDLLVAWCVRTRTVWLENRELAHLAVAVGEPNDAFMRENEAIAAMIRAAGFPNVPLAYSAIQNFTMGCVLTAASRSTSSAFFGRDPRKVLAVARRLATRRNASADQRGVIEARFDVGDELHFEPALRALIDGLLAG